MGYSTAAVDQQLYDMISQAQKRSGARTFSDALRLMLGLPPSSQLRTREQVIASVKAVLGEHPDSTAAEVAQAIELGYPTITTILVELEKTGQVQRKPLRVRRPGPTTYLWSLRRDADADAVRLCDLVAELRQQAVEEVAQARDELAKQLDKGHGDLTEAMTAVVYKQHYARWWDNLADNLNGNVLGEVAALMAIRDNARQALLALNARASCGSCPYTRDPAAILREATSAFCRDTDPAALQSCYGITLPAGLATTDGAE
jgi:predicted ArsR family transcriptional regulator